MAFFHRSLVLFGASVMLASACTPSTQSDTPAAPTPTGVPTASAVPDPEPLEWAPCPPDRQPEPIEGAAGRSGDFQCATLTVPLDYDEPDGPTIEIAVGRLAARDQAARLGSIVVNPGGPGAGGVELAAVADLVFPDAVTNGFDIVGFDPRGVGASAQIECFDSEQRTVDALPSPNVPTNNTERTVRLEAEQAFAQACVTNAGPIIDHMSTANVARDMEMLRKATGEQMINYVGFSYGSLLGATYSNLFPDRVRAMVLDGAVNPDEWINDRHGPTDPTFGRLDGGSGARAVLDQFFAQCDAAGPEHCALAPNAAERFAALLDRSGSPSGLVLQQEDVDEDGFGTGEYGTARFNRPAFLDLTFREMYSATGWRAFAQTLANAEPDTLTADGSEINEELLGIEAQYWGVVCSESDNPTPWVELNDDGSASEANLFAGVEAWSTSMCASWPGRDEDRYAGPWIAATRNPVLVISNRYDPATPLSDAREMAELLGNSALLIAEGWGHGVTGNNDCADEVLAQYLLTPQRPDIETCASTGNPFTDDERSFDGPPQVGDAPGDGLDPAEDLGGDGESEFELDAESIACLEALGVDLTAQEVEIGPEAEKCF